MKKHLHTLLAVIMLAVGILAMFPADARADAASGGEYNFKEASYDVVVSAPDYYVNFRYGPGLEYAVDCPIYNGEILHIRRTADNYYDNLKWGQTYYQGRYGWVSLSQTTRIGWVKSGGNWYYYDSYGKMKTGWVKTGGKWYYMNSYGIMQTGWVKVKGKWYYLKSSGAMATGWIKVKGKWYYMNKSGVMQTGWVKVKGKWYYLNKSGVMQTGWVKIGSKQYHFNSSGVWDN